MREKFIETFRAITNAAGISADKFSLEEIVKFFQVFIDNPFSSFSNVLTIGQLIIGIKNYLKKNCPFLYSEWKFWDNMDKFFNSGILTEDDKRKLIDKLSNDKTSAETGKKIIALIGKTDTDQKLACILNATKALANNLIELNIYFRICNSVLNTLEEDLQFLKSHIEENTIDYSISVGGLITVGLACHRGIIEGNSKSYAFTELAKIVNEYALKGDGRKRIEEFKLNESPQNTFSVATDEEVAEHLDEIFNQATK